MLKNLENNGTEEIGLVTPTQVPEEGNFVDMLLESDVV